MMAWLLQDEVFETAGSCKSTGHSQATSRGYSGLPGIFIPTQRPAKIQPYSILLEPSNPLLTAL